MKFSATVRTGRRMEQVVPVFQYQLYHANSRLDYSMGRALASPEATDPTLRFLGTRGFRNFAGARFVSLDCIMPSRKAMQKIMASRRSGRRFGGSIELNELATVLEQALGCTNVLTDTEAGLTHALRAWPSAGGLYPIDTYVAARQVEGLEAGVYHYNPILQRLEEVCAPPVTDFIRRAFLGQNMTDAAAVALVFVANFERTTSKYGERGYRLVMLDAGHAGQNVLLTAAQLGLQATAVGGFSDDAICSDLHLDGVDEAPVHAIILGRPS